jgi:penicillin-binding protein 1A
MSRFRRLLRWALLAFLGAAVLGVLGLGLLYFLIAPKLPDVDQLRHVELQEPMYVYSRDGRLMALFGETRRYPIEIEKAPARLKQAFIAIEDSRFYEHHGVDYKGVARAVWLLATTNDKRVPGGSTITQQVARQFFLSSEYSYTRKLAEMMLAMRMESELTKDEIFELYLNKSFFGNRAYGVGAAAEFYYGKSLDQLTLDEMATLASIPKFPSSGNPITNPERAKLRRDYVLQRMRELGFIPAAEERAAAATAMHATPHERPIEVYAPYVAEMVRQEMVARFGGDVLTKGYHVTTTIDPKLQTAADQAIRDGLAVYDHRHGWRGAEKQVDVAAGETPEQLRAHLRGLPTQGGLMAALVTGTEDSQATVLLADGTEVQLDPDATRWIGKSPAALFKRGDIVRIRAVVPKPADAKDGKAPKPVADATPRWEVDQLPRAQSALVSLEAENRCAARAGRRFQLCRQQVQPRHASPPAAGFELQAVPLCGCLRARLQPCVHRARRAGGVPRSPRPYLAAAERLGQLRRPDAPARSARAIAQPRVRAPARCDRRGLRAQVHQPLRLQRSGPAAQPLDVARHGVARAAVDCARLCRLRQWRLPRQAVAGR